MKNEEKLNSNLQKYGLNPSEWVIKALSNKKYIIENKTDQNFKLFGTTQKKSKGKSDWSQIQVMSL